MQYHLPMNVYRGVIDTNVLHAGLYSSRGASYQILRMVENGRLTPILSATLVFEYEDVLRRKRKMLRLSDAAIDAILDGLCSRGECRSIHFLWRPQLADPKDDHVLELSVAADGADIVTHNIHDFARATSFGMRIITPAQLLGELK